MKQTRLDKMNKIWFGIADYWYTRNGALSEFACTAKLSEQLQSNIWAILDGVFAKQVQKILMVRAWPGEEESHYAVADIMLDNGLAVLLEVRREFDRWINRE